MYFGVFFTFSHKIYAFKDIKILNFQQRFFLYLKITSCKKILDWFENNPSNPKYAMKNAKNVIFFVFDYIFLRDRL